MPRHAFTTPSTNAKTCLHYSSLIINYVYFQLSVNAKKTCLHYSIDQCQDMPSPLQPNSLLFDQCQDMHSPLQPNFTHYGSIYIFSFHQCQDMPSPLQPNLIIRPMPRHAFHHSTSINAKTCLHYSIDQCQDMPSTTQPNQDMPNSTNAKTCLHSSLTTLQPLIISTNAKIRSPLQPTPLRLSSTKCQDIPPLQPNHNNAYIFQLDQCQDMPSPLQPNH
ncbi:unnamed protein product [Mytilus edulis]|uniref:Uncharacterized protein n=1 Tax=Mytilus edulis TaxID=6550 RepID=A0A8S3T1I5_MYTED|nr:unnamed protein product [Mytilus edulis]